jgi:carboxylesterase
MGLSMGGALSLHLAAHHPVAGVVALSTPSVPLLASMDWRARIAGPLSYLIPFKPKGAPDPNADLEHVAYEQYPVRAVVQLRALLRVVDAALPRVRAPSLLVHSRGDRSVPAENATYIFGRLGSADKQQLWLERSGHIVTEGPEREVVFAAVLAFVRAHAGSPAPMPAPRPSAA